MTFIYKLFVMKSDFEIENVDLSVVVFSDNLNLEWFHIYSGMGQASSRSDSEYSDITSDVDMEDVSMLRSVTDIISPDDGSDDYSFMSIGSSDDNSGLPYVRRKHRPKSLNLSRSHSATSSEDETTDSAISTDVESKYNAVMPPDPHELRIALAASAFVEDMRVADMANDTDEEVAEISSAREESGENRIRFSPSAPISRVGEKGLKVPHFHREDGTAIPENDAVLHRYHQKINVLPTPIYLRLHVSCL